MRSATAFGAAVLFGAASLIAAGADEKAGATKGNRDGQPSVTANANETAPDGTTPLHRAVRAGDLARAQVLIKTGANVDAVTRYGVTAMSLAALNGDAAMIDLLLKAGADANSSSAMGETVLMTAARSGNPALVKALIAHGADVNAREGWQQQTALMWAAAQNHAAVVEILAAAGADLNAKALVMERHGLGGGANTTSPPGGLTPLLYAARNGAVEATRTLLGAGADIDLTDPNGSTPLVYALINSHFDVAALLLEKGANPNIYDSAARGPLFVAVDMHSLEYRARPEPKITDRFTSADLVTMLLEHGADVDHRLAKPIIAPKAYAVGNHNLSPGSTPFLKAATTSDAEMMQLLLDWGADPYATNQSHTNALILAAGVNWRTIYSRGTQEEAIDAVKLCLALGMDINAADDSGQTALHGAAMRTEERDANKLIEFLVGQGSNLYASNKAGRLPRDEATGELPTGESAGGDRRAINHRSLALIEQLMKTHADPSKNGASAQR